VKFFLRLIDLPGVVVHVYNPSTWEANTGGLGVQSQPGLYSKTLSQKTVPPKQKTPKVNKLKFVKDLDLMKHQIYINNYFLFLKVWVKTMVYE
jgi:hypothetical protein